MIPEQTTTTQWKETQWKDRKDTSTHPLLSTKPAETKLHDHGSPRHSSSKV
jgi:hypothetical protein